MAIIYTVGFITQNYPFFRTDESEEQVIDDPGIPGESSSTGSSTVTSSPALTSSPLPEKKKSVGITAKRLQDCANILEQKRLDSLNHQRNISQLYEKEVGEAAAFREALLKKKDDKLNLVRELFGAK